MSLYVINKQKWIAEIEAYLATWVLPHHCPGLNKIKKDKAGELKSLLQDDNQKDSQLFKKCREILADIKASQAEINRGKLILFHHGPGRFEKLIEKILSEEVFIDDGFNLEKLKEKLLEELTAYQDRTSSFGRHAELFHKKKTIVDRLKTFLGSSENITARNVFDQLLSTLADLESECRQTNLTSIFVHRAGVLESLLREAIGALIPKAFTQDEQWESCTSLKEALRLQAQQLPALKAISDVMELGYDQVKEKIETNSILANLDRERLEVKILLGRILTLKMLTVDEAIAKVQKVANPIGQPSALGQG